MYARRQKAQKRQRAAQLAKFVSPISGWVANRALADPQSVEGPGASVLDNFFPRSTAVTLRRGQQRYATLDDEDTVTSLFSYRNGGRERLFATTRESVWDITDVVFARSEVIGTEAGDIIVTENDEAFGWSSVSWPAVLSGLNGGDWQVAQFAATGTTYLIGVNGLDAGFIYDGFDFYPINSSGYWRLPYDNGTAMFSEGEIVTGSVSGAYGTVYRPEPSSVTDGVLILRDVVGDFQEDDMLSVSGVDFAQASADSEKVIPGMSFGAIPSNNMAYVWVYKNRLFFAEKGSMNAWYNTAVDSVGGTYDVLPFGGIFELGGSLLFGSAWSMSTSGSGGLSEQCVFVSSEGEVAIYQGDDPGNAQDWTKIGTYRIGRPMGRNAFFRGGGDLAIATTVGLVPLSKAIELDVTALNVATLSYKIADAWGDALALRGDNNWICHIWAEGKMAFVSPPDPTGIDSPVLFVSNTETGAWCRFTGWNVTSAESFRGRMYFGSTGGRVFIANSGGNDDGAVYSGAVAPLHEDLGSPASRKIPTTGRARIRATMHVQDNVSVLYDFNTELPASPAAVSNELDNTWGTGVWGTSIWSEPATLRVYQDWRSVGGQGYALAPLYQVSSGSLSPLDVELIDIELMVTTAETVT